MHRYTQEQINYVRQVRRYLTHKELVECFFDRFGEYRTLIALKALSTRHGISTCRKGGLPIGYSRIISKEQEKFIRVEYVNHPVKKLTELFNEKFGTQLKPGQIKTFITKNNIICGRSGQFETGHTPVNKGTKGLTGANKTSFKKGHVPATVKPFGHERIDKKDGYIWVKVDMKNPYTGYRGHYILKHHLIWEQHHGPIPKGMILKFKDGNKLNCDINNLEMITKSEHVRLNALRYSDAPDELKPTIKAIAALQRKSNELKRQKRKAA